MKRPIGSPNSYEKNLSEGESSFERTHDLKIPIRETDQGRVAFGKKSTITNEQSELDVGELVLEDPAPGQNVRQKPTVDEVDYLPVSCLNTYVQDWTIKVKIAKKYEMRTWKNERGEGTLLNLDLMDKQGGMI